MPYKQDTELDLKPRTNSKYIISSQHRKTGNMNKSTWTISHDEEVECFVLSKISNWTVDYIGWGVKLAGRVLQIVGRNDANSELKFAKFVDGSKKNIWHGWPADYKNRKQDIPATNVLLSWNNSKYISKSHVRKIKQQISCNL
jgi:hypothetical protein